VGTCQCARLGRLPKDQKGTSFKLTALGGHRMPTIGIWVNGR
jgi:hypothetical protein